MSSSDSDSLLDAADRERLREFAAGQMLARPHLLRAGARIADQIRQLLPSLGDETIAAVMACASQIAGHHLQETSCPHVQSVGLLLQATVVDLAHLELDPPDGR